MEMKSPYLVPLATLALMASGIPAVAQSVDKSEALVGGLISLGALFIIAIVYFSPTIIAFRKNHKNKWLYLLLNTVVGITVIGWIVLIILVHLDIYINEDGKIINNARST